MIYTILNLSFDPFQGKYIKTLPLHKTLEIIIDTEYELRIKLKLYVTYDFLMDILSFGQSVKVIKPESLINELKIAYENALNFY